MRFSLSPLGSSSAPLLPTSHVDLRTQLSYQGMDQTFVGLIYSAFNYDPKLGQVGVGVVGVVMVIVVEEVVVLGV